MIRPRCRGWAGRPASERHASSLTAAAGPGTRQPRPEPATAARVRPPPAAGSGLRLAGQANADAGAQRTPVQPAAAARTPPSAAVDSPDEPRASPAPAPAARQRGPELSRQHQGVAYPDSEFPATFFGNLARFQKGNLALWGKIWHFLTETWPIPLKNGTFYRKPDSFWGWKLAGNWQGKPSPVSQETLSQGN